LPSKKKEMRKLNSRPAFFVFAGLVFASRTVLGAPLLPDIIMEAHNIAQTTNATTGVKELRFSTWTINVGAGPLELRATATSTLLAAVGARDGYTAEQRFFLGFGRVWCSKQRPEYSRMQVTTNPHSPGKFRVNGVVQNMPEFQKAWGCKAGQPMVAENACHVW